MQSCYCAVLERVRQKASGSAKNREAEPLCKVVIAPSSNAFGKKQSGSAKNREAKPLGGVVIAPSVAAARTLMQSLPAMAVAREEGVRG